MLSSKGKKCVPLQKVLNVMNVVLLANVLIALLGYNKYFSFIAVLFVAGITVFLTRLILDNNLTSGTETYTKPIYKVMAIASFPILTMVLLYFKEWIFLLMLMIFMALFYYFNRFMKQKDWM
jgi:hypothetical protein